MFKKIQQQKAYTHIVEQILDLIKSGTLIQGEKLPSEVMLTEDFGVSRPTIRQALSALEVLGAIECKGGKGNYIRNQINIDSLRYQSSKLEKQISPEQILECRKVVEPGIAGLAARKAKPSDILDLEKCVNEYKNLVQSKCDENVFEKVIQNSRDFHLTLAKATYNDTLVQIIRFVIQGAKGKIWLHLEGKMLGIPGRLEKYLSEHLDILDAVKSSNEEKAREIMKGHIEGMRKDVFD